MVFEIGERTFLSYSDKMQVMHYKTKFLEKVLYHSQFQKECFHVEENIETSLEVIIWPSVWAVHALIAKERF